MRPRTRHSLLALLSFLLVCAPPAASAQVVIYRWIDGEGGVHFSQGIDSVPPRFRAGAVIVGHDRAPEPGAPTTPGPGPGVGQVRFTPGEPIMVMARINGTGSAQLMLDTGATRTLISPSALSAIGVDPENAARALLKGVTGEAEVYAVKLDSIEVGGAKFGPLLVISHDAGLGPEKSDGLLGRDYLDNFTITIDNAAGLLTLTPK